MRKVAERALANSAVIRNRTVVEMERDMKRAGLTLLLCCCWCHSAATASALGSPGLLPWV